MWGHKSLTMKIEPPADDHGLQQLKASDRAKGQVQEVDHVEKTARIAPSEEHHEPRPVTPRPRQGDRRQAERRRRQEQVLLDTRSPHARRTEVRREDDQQDTTPPRSGIDELA